MRGDKIAALYVFLDSAVVTGALIVLGLFTRPVFLRSTWARPRCSTASSSFISLRPALALGRSTRSERKLGNPPSTLVRSIRLDSFGTARFWFENPRSDVSDFLGFPWILSSKSRLFNGLRGKSGERFFVAVFPSYQPRRNMDPPVLTRRNAELLHRVSIL